MQIHLFSTVFILLCSYAFVQKGTKQIPLKKLQGTYQGWTSQDINGTEVYYKTIFKIKTTKNNIIKGQSTFYDNMDSTQVLVVYNLEGTYDASNQMLKLKEYEVIKKSKNWIFCFKEMPLECVIENGKTELRGIWTAKNCPNTGGKVRVIKEK
jgi:hypothetical protein